MMTDFQINGVDYQARKLNAMDQFHLGRKLAHVLGFLAAQKDRSTLEATFPRAFTALSSHISKEDMDEVARMCWGAVQRRQPTGWVPLAPGGLLMFNDIDDMRSLLTVIWHVLQANGLIDFFVEPLSGSGTGTTEATG
jgi:hypothetical protein